MPAECTTPVFGVFTSFLNVAAGGLIGFLSARVISDRNACATAKAKFRAAFVPALAMVTATAIKNTTDVSEFNLSAHLKEAFVQHAGAIEEFRPFIPKKQRITYQRAWEHYLELGPIWWNGAAEFMADFEEKDKDSKPAHEVIRDRIKALLEHAKPDRSLWSRLMDK